MLTFGSKQRRPKSLFVKSSGDVSGGIRNNEHKASPTLGPRSTKKKQAAKSNPFDTIGRPVNVIGPCQFETFEAFHEYLRPENCGATKTRPYPVLISTVSPQESLPTLEDDRVRRATPGINISEASESA